jgi:hypothetical protein
MAEHAPGVVARVSEGVAAGVPEHVRMDRKGEAGAVADALDQSLDGVRRERSARSETRARQTRLRGSR